MEATKTKELVILEKKVSAIRGSAELVVITDDESMLKAAEIRKEIKNYAKAVKEEKEKATKPLKEVVKTITGWFINVETDCDVATAQIESKMRIYQNEVDEKNRKIAAEAARKIAEAEALVKAGEITEAKAEKVIAKAEAKVEAAPEVITKSADFHTRTNRKVRFANLKEMTWYDWKKLIDSEYLVWDEVKARKAALDGSLAIGVEIYEEQSFV